MGKIKQHKITLGSDELALASYCIGTAMRQFMKEIFMAGKPITDQGSEDLARLQEKLESVH